MSIWNLKQADTEVHTYIRGAAPGDIPVTVNAPVIADGMTQEGVQPLLDMVASLTAHSNTETAEKEAERLEPYFGALSIYLTRALEDVSPENKETLKELIAPGQLSGLFNAMAAYTRNTLLCDVAIMPDSIAKGPAKHLFKDTAYNPTFKYGEHSFSFGFLQVYEGGKKKKAHSSTTIPTFTLDTQRMNEIAPHQPAELLHLFQNVVTVMNHDMLHHFQSPWINDIIAHKFIKGGGYDKKGDIVQWAYSLTGGRVEEWSQLTHGKIFMTPENEALIKDTGAKLDLYFNELERIGKALPKEKAHDVIDYFGTVMAQTLSRTFPLNHPLVTQCVDRMQKADPFSEKELLEATLVQYIKMTMTSPSQYDKMPWSSSSPLEAVRKRVGVEMKVIVQGYRQQGCDILSDDDNVVSYQGIKLLQLAKIETTDMRSHVPTPVDPKVVELRAGSDQKFLELIGTVAKVTDYSPAP